MTLIESTPDAGTGALIRQDPLLMPDPEPLFSKCYKVPRAGKDRSSVTEKSNPIPKPTALGLQPQLALDMTWSLTIMSQEGQPRKRLAGLGSPALRKKLNPSAFYHECALTTLIRKERKTYQPIRRQIERARRMEDSPINKRGTRSCQTSFRPLCLPLADRTNWPKPA